MRLRCLVFVLLLLTAGRLPAQEPAASLETVIADTRRAILDSMAAHRIPGAQIAVIREGRLLWSEGFGLADVEQQVPVTAITRFRIASISKAVTAVGLGLLVQEGKVDLDSPVQHYVPYFPLKPWPVTVRQVAGHLAGIRHYREGEFESMKRYPTVQDGVAIFADDSLLFEPGTKYSYSSYGWNLISAVIEGASGEPFLTFMQRRVFGPMGMTRTIPEWPDTIIPWRARAYVHTDSLSPVENAPYVDNSYKWAGGGFLSTAEDLARMGRNLLDGKVLTPTTVEILWTEQKLRDGGPTHYGIGWGTYTDDHGHRLVAHTGGAMGGTSHLVIFRDQKLVLALIMNSDETFIRALPAMGERFLMASE